MLLCCRRRCPMPPRATKLAIIPRAQKKTAMVEYAAVHPKRSASIKLRAAVANPTASKKGNASKLRRTYWETVAPIAVLASATSSWIKGPSRRVSGPKRHRPDFVPLKLSASSLRLSGFRLHEPVEERIEHGISCSRRSPRFDGTGVELRESTRVTSQHISAATPIGTKRCSRNDTSLCSRSARKGDLTKPAQQALGPKTVGGALA